MLYRYSIQHPKSVIAIAVLATFAMAPGMLYLQIRTDGHALIPTHAPEIELDQAIREEFGVEDIIVVLIRSDHPHGLFNGPTLELVATLTDEFQQIEGIHPWNIMSLATEHSDRVRPGTLIFRKFLEPFPQTRKELDLLRDDLRAIKLYTGTLVSQDEKATAIFVGVPATMDRTELHRTLAALISEKGSHPEEIRVIGPTIAEALLGIHILEDLGVPSVLLGGQTVSSGDTDPGATPGNFHEWRLWVGRHIGLVPLALGVMAIVFYISFHSLPAVALPLMEVGACLLAVFGLMGWLGVPVYLTIAVLPVILTAIGVADEIHIFTRYQDQLRAQPDASPIDLLVRTMSEMGTPIVKTSVTTAVGFLSFSLSPIGPVRAFGLFTAAGIIFCMFWSLTVIPAMLAIVKPTALAAQRRGGGGRQAAASPIFSRVGAAVIRHRYLVVVAALIVIGVMPWGVRQVEVQDSWIDGFAPDSEFYRATQQFNEQFLGTHVLFVCVDTGQQAPLTGQLAATAVWHHGIRIPAGDVAEPASLVGHTVELWRVDPPPGAGQPSVRHRRRYPWDARIARATRDGDQIALETVRQEGSPRLSLRLHPQEQARYKITPRYLTWPKVIRRIDKLEQFIEAHRAEAVGGVLGPASYLKTTNFMARARRESERRISDEPNRIEWLWKQYGQVRGPERLRQTVSADYSRALISVYLKNANFVDTQRLIDDIRQYEQEELAPYGISLSLAGDVAVSQTLITAIVTTQVRSLIVSLVGIFLITSLLNRSMVWGFLCVLPCAVAVLINFAVMGWVGMPLGIATSMFSGMTLGIGVDYAIHFSERYRRSRRTGLAVEPALTDAVQATGPAILIDALAVGLGFGILIFSQVPANARLAGLVVLSIVNCLAVTLLLLPGLIRIFQPRIPGDDSTTIAMAEKG